MGERCRSVFHSYPTDDKIFIYGNQKSGTSAVAKLLSIATNEQVQVDFCGAWYPHFDMVKGVNLEKFINVNRYAFSKKIIKEPNITHLVQPLSHAFPNSKHIIVIRDPVKNILSILSRLELTGSSSLDDIGHLTKAWQEILSGRDIGFSHHNIALNLTYRWCHFYKDIGDNVTLLKYEDFLEDKVGFISSLSQDLGYREIKDIEPFINVQYQPKGKLSDMNIESFFGESLLKEIKTLINLNPTANKHYKI
jgi:hypothetical protein